MLAHVRRNGSPHQRNQRLVAEILARARAPELQQLAIEPFDALEIELVLRIETDGRARSRAEQQAVSSHDIFGFYIADNEMIAYLVKLVGVQAVGIGSLEAFLHFQVENFKP